jgi:hypothetical protein
VDSQDGPKEACKTYIEQTKLLVTLASAFVVAPAAIVAFFEGKNSIGASPELVSKFLWAEGLFVFSVLSGYLVRVLSASLHDLAGRTLLTSSVA